VILPSGFELGLLGLLSLTALGPVAAALYLAAALHRGPGDGDSEI
jgi:hypothetical protein